MLRTDDRALLSEALAPPDGYQLDTLVGTTYSLQLAALLSIPLSLTFVDWEDETGRPNVDPVAALEAVRRHAERITVFAQAGEIGAGGQPPLVASWLEDVVTPVAASDEQGVFHPKVWVARFTSSEHEPCYRAVCASRNLTFDRSWDTVLVLDGTPSARGGRVAESAPLADFIASLPDLSVGEMPPQRAVAVRALGEDLRRVRFAPPAGFEAVRFWPLGVRGHRRFPFDTRMSRLLVVSPFVGQGLLARFKPERGENVLVSRPDELAMIATARLPGFQRTAAFDDLGVEDQSDAAGSGLRGLHAKLYVADAGWDANVWTGSANATTAAFEHNVEFLVQLSGKRQQCGVDAFLGRPDDPSALNMLLTDVPPREVALEPDPRAVLEREVDAMAKVIASRQFEATVTPEGDQYAVALTATPGFAWPNDTELRCWPLTESRDRHPTPLTPEGTGVARFAPMPIESLTAFYGFELLVRRNGLELAKAFLVRAELSGVPEGRREAIIRSVLRDPQQVLRLLRLLLAFDAEDGAPGQEPLLGISTAGSWIQGETPLLESLLRALSEAPQRVSAIASLIRELQDAGPDLLPAGFLDIWEPVWAEFQREQGAWRA
jgi:hypothetical protein